MKKNTVVAVLSTVAVVVAVLFAYVRWDAFADLLAKPGSTPAGT